MATNEELLRTAYNNATKNNAQANVGTSKDVGATVTVGGGTANSTGNGVANASKPWAGGTGGTGSVAAGSTNQGNGVSTLPLYGGRPVDSGSTGSTNIGTDIPAYGTDGWADAVARGGTSIPAYGTSGWADSVIKPAKPGATGTGGSGTTSAGNMGSTGTTGNTDNNGVSTLPLHWGMGTANTNPGLENGITTLPLYWENGKPVNGSNSGTTDSTTIPEYGSEGWADAVTKPTRPGSTMDSGFGYPGNWTKPSRPGATGSGTSGSTGTAGAGTSKDVGATVTVGGGTSSTGGDTTGTTGSGTSGTTGTSSGNKSAYGWYQDYLNQLGNYTTPSATSQADYIKQMYDANLAANKSQLESDYNQNLSDLDAEASTLGQTYYEQQRQAQAEADRNKQSFQEYANARGLNSGTGGQAELARSNQLSANMNNLRQSEAEKRAEIERQRVLLGQQYQSAIQQAQAENDLEKAKALYEEAVRVDESLTSAAQADADRALQMFNILSNTVQAGISATGDTSAYSTLLSGLGLSSADEAETLYNKAQQITSSGGYYTTSSSGKTTYTTATQEDIDWAAYYINIIRAAGGIDNVQTYLATHYKLYNIPYQSESRDTAKMAETAKNFSDEYYIVGSDLGKTILDGMTPGATYEANDGSIWEMKENGNIYATKNGITMEIQRG